MFPEKSVVNGFKWIEEPIHEDWAGMLTLIEMGYLPKFVDTLVLHYTFDMAGNYGKIRDTADALIKKHFPKVKI